MNKGQKKGLILLALGFVLVLCALGIHLAQKQEDAYAGQMSALLLEQLDQRVPGEESETQETPATDVVMPEKKYMDYTLLGSVRVPGLGIRLPVLDDWSYSMMKVAPCRYAGSLSGGGLIIMGHNYKSHFDPLKHAKVGEEVIFENTLGATFSFRIAKVERLDGDDGKRLTASSFPLTLFTCTPDGQARIVVRCEKAD